VENKEIMFKSLENARRIASISNEIEEMFERLTFNTANSEIIIYLINKVREKHGDKVAQSLADEIHINPVNEIEFFRTKNIINIARGFLNYREYQKKVVYELASEKIELSNTEIPIYAVIDKAYFTPFRVSIHDEEHGLLLNNDDIEKVKKIKDEIEKMKERINDIKSKYFL